MDEPTILFREPDSLVLLFLPEENESVTAKMAGLEGYILNDDAKGFFVLEYVQPMMALLQFNEQFKQGIKTKSLLRGWISKLPFDIQNNMVDSERKKYLPGSQLTRVKNRKS